MDKFREKIGSALEKENLNEDFLEIVPDLESESVRSKIFTMLIDVYNSKMPFNRLLGVKVTELSLDRAVIEIDSREDLHGNYIQQILHGGVISSVIDLTGGITAQAHAINRMKGKNIGQMLQRFSKMSTINLNVDFLRPGSGMKFRCISKIVRAGNKVAVVRMEMLDSANEEIAIGSGSYLVG